MPDPWQRFGEIWFSIMRPCCVPPICEATIRRVPSAYCPMFSPLRWEKAIAAWDAQPRDDQDDAMKRSE